MIYAITLVSRDDYHIVGFDVAFDKSQTYIVEGVNSDLRHYISVSHPNTRKRALPIFLGSA